MSFEMVLVLALIYPAVAAAIAWAASRYSIDSLRHELRTLDNKLAALTVRAQAMEMDVQKKDVASAPTAPLQSPATPGDELAMPTAIDHMVAAAARTSHVDTASGPAAAEAVDLAGEPSKAGSDRAAAPADNVSTTGTSMSGPAGNSAALEPETSLQAPAQVVVAVDAAPGAHARPTEATGELAAPVAITIEAADAVAAPTTQPQPAAAEYPQQAAVALPSSVSLDATPAWVARLMSGAKAWLLGGNLVAKLGLVILFFGVAFLLKYVAATVDIPIEIRLAAVVFADLALLGWGWRIRNDRREIALPLQGTATAILMLVVFGAFQRYGLIPAGAAFALLVVLTASTCALALFQDAPWLAAFGITGGFASPLLVATGNGNHIALFSYYALLNVGIFAIALRRAWRPLNLLGLWFTFTVGTGWGALRYTPDHYLSSQVFLVLFFLFYVAIALAYARQRQPHFRDYIDVSIVLGTPLLASGLQAALVHDREYGLALSALALGAFYVALAAILWRRDGNRWRLLVETFAALGAIFTTLAIPYAVNGRWTGAAWAMEGAGFVWYGLRAGVVRVRVSGLILQAGAALSFVGACGGLDEATARASNLWLGCLLLGTSAFATAVLYRRRSLDTPFDTAVSSGMLAIAAVWLLSAWWGEAMIRISGHDLADWLAIGAVFTAALLHAVGQRMTWRLAHVLAAVAEVAGAFALGLTSGIWYGWLGRLELDDYTCPLIGPALLALAILGSARAFAHESIDEDRSDMSRLLLGLGGVIWFGPVLNVAAGRVADLLPNAIGSTDGRWLATYALLSTLCAIASPALAKRLRWTSLRWLGAACWAILAVVTCAGLLTLYGARRLPEGIAWVAWAILWCGGEYLLSRTPRLPIPAGRVLLQALHVVRTVAPWLALWPAGRLALDGWLHAAVGSPADIDFGTWSVSVAWSDYIPTWTMMLALIFLARRNAEQWPVRPLSSWYRAVLVPGGAVLILLRTCAWNLTQDGGMAPLPYLPLLNPLDITSVAAIALGVVALRDWAATAPGAAPMGAWVPPGAATVAFAWLNLLLLRSASHYLGIPYWVEDLAASQEVQATLSLAWSASALLLMSYAARRTMRKTWCVGAVQLAVVVGKLFLVDLSSHGSVARIVSFLGVGLLMVLIGYFAPFPKAAEARTTPAASSVAPKETP